MTEIDKPTDRRRLLRRAGTLAAGVAGAGVAGAVTATPAAAAAKNADGPATFTTHDPGGAAVTCSNTFQELGGGGTGPALRLVPFGDSLYHAAPAGSLSADRFGIPWVSIAYSENNTNAHRLLTTFNSNTIVPIFPTRAVDTRTAATRTRIIDPSVLDSAGRLPRNRTMDVDLSDLAFFPDAVLLNATVTGQTTAGYLTVFPWLGTQPGIASLNYSPNQNLTNLVFTAYGHDSGQSPASGISVFTSQLTHVILDVVGFVIGNGAVNPAVVPGALAPTGGAAVTDAAQRRAQAMRKSKPRWE
jgi:hypothetical protein